MAVSPLPTASSKTAAIARSPSAAAAAASRPRASPIARSAVNAPPPTAPAPSSSSSSRREPPSLQGSDADKLREGIATFYDESSQLWEDIWGEHMHHGFYPRGTDRKAKTNAQAQIDLIDAVLTFAGVSNVKEMVDVGCGIGGSSRHIANKFPSAKATGITLSPRQAARANELARAQGLGDRATFQVADALKQPFADGSFDLVWSLESGEHMPDKRAFVNELARVAAPGGEGTVVVATWVHRDLEQGESDLTKKELKLLGKINRAYYLPPWCSGADYKDLFESAGLVDIKTEDWSPDVAPFWGEVIKTALTPRGVVGLLKAGWGTIRGALAMPLMARGFKRGLIKFVIITGKTSSKA